MNYSPSTRERVADLVRGLYVETSVFINHSYMHTEQAELFNVYGRIMLFQLFIEAITANGTGATQLLFNYTSITPGVAAQNLCTKCASIASLPRGGRIVWTGDENGAAVITVAATGGVSDVINVLPFFIGMEGGVGTIGIFTSDADPDSATATSQAALTYVPMSDGAYVTKVI